MPPQPRRATGRSMQVYSIRIGVPPVRPDDISNTLCQAGQ